MIAFYKTARSFSKQNATDVISYPFTRIVCNLFKGKFLRGIVIKHFDEIKYLYHNNSYIFEILRQKFINYCLPLKECECVPLSSGESPTRYSHDYVYSLPLNIDLLNYYMEQQAEDNAASERAGREQFIRASRSNPEGLREHLFNTWIKKGRGSIRRKYYLRSILIIVNLNHCLDGSLNQMM